MLIGPEEMALHITEGRAEPWTAELGVGRDVLDAVRMDDTWYVVLAGTDGYQPAPDPMASVLSDWQQSLRIAAEKIAALTRDNGTGRP